MRNARPAAFSRRTLRNSESSIWLTAAVAVYLIGVVGYSRHQTSVAGGASMLDAWYYPLQLFALQPPAIDDGNWWIEVARWGAALVTGSAFIGVVRQAFSSRREIRRLRSAAGHVVIWAEGQVAMALAQAVGRPRRRTTWVVTPEPVTADGIRMRSPNVGVLVSDSEGAVTASAAHRAALLVIAGFDDAENVAIAAEACQAARQRRDRTRPLVCRVQVRSPELRESLRILSLPAERSRCVVQAFDFFEHAARGLFTARLPLDGPGIGPDDPRQVHVIILGTTEWGVTAALAAAHLGHFANRRRLSLSVIGENFEAWHRRLGMRTAAVSDVCEYREVQHHPLSAGAVRAMENALHDTGARTLVVGCPETDAEAIALLGAWSRLPALSDTRFAIRVSRSRGMPELVEESGRSNGTRTVPFGWFDDAARAGLLGDDSREVMARLVHEKFRALASARGRTEAVDRALFEWHELVPEDLKESCRHQVDHIPIKLRAVGCEAAPEGDPRPAAVWSFAEVETLAEMEHTRWVAERRLAGWRHRDAPRNDRERTSPHIKDWEHLSEDVKEYDRDAVKNIPALLRTACGKKVCRRPIA